METAGYASAEAFMADSTRSKFDCLVLDIQLGGMSGVELQKRLLAERSRVPIIFITAHDDPGPRAHAEAGGCVGFFRKTDPGKQIIEAIRNVVGRVERH